MLKLILFFNLQLLLGITSFAQKEKIDSLKKLLPSLRDSARIDCLVQLGVQYKFSNNHDSSLSYTRIVYEESKRINYVHGIAEAYTMMAYTANTEKHFNKGALTLARESLKWFGLTNNKKKIEVAYLAVGGYLLGNYEFEEAAWNYQQSSEWAKKNGNVFILDKALAYLYIAQMGNGDYDKAFESFQQNQELRQAINGKRDTLDENEMLAGFYRGLGDFPNALICFREVVRRMDLKEADIHYRTVYPELLALNGLLDSASYYYDLIDTSKRNNDPHRHVNHDLRFYLISKGEFYLLKNDFSQALTCLLRGLHYSRDANDLGGVNRALFGLAKAYASLQNDKAALEYAREGLEISTRTKSRHGIRDAYEILYAIYDKNGPTDSALMYYRKFINQKERVASDMLKGRFASYGYEQTLKFLEKEKQLQQQIASKAGEQRNYLLAVIVAIVFMGIVFVRSIMLKRKNEEQRRKMAENDLKLQKSDQEKREAELQQQATELEMQALRAQMNPHFIFNSLNSINRFILQNNKAQASEYLTKFSKLVRMILQNSQASLINLESELESLELYLDLEALRFNYQFAYRISVPKDMDIEVLKVPPLIIQPYAENAIWHGLMHKEEKGLLDIEIFQDNNYLFVKITDDGIGRKHAAELASKSATRHKSMGLKITADRIAMLHRLNGHESPVTINDLVHPDGRPAGTEVIIKMPVKYN